MIPRVHSDWTGSSLLVLMTLSDSKPRDKREYINTMNNVMQLIYCPNLGAVFHTLHSEVMRLFVRCMEHDLQMNVVRFTRLLTHGLHDQEDQWFYDAEEIFLRIDAYDKYNPSSLHKFLTKLALSQP